MTLTRINVLIVNSQTEENGNQDGGRKAINIFFKKKKIAWQKTLQGVPTQRDASAEKSIFFVQTVLSEWFYFLLKNCYNFEKQFIIFKVKHIKKTCIYVFFSCLELAKIA